MSHLDQFDLANSIDLTVGKMSPDSAPAVKNAFGCTNRLIRDFMFAYFDVNEKLQVDRQSKKWLAFTFEKVGFGQRKGFGTPETNSVFDRSEVDYIGIGESSHYDSNGRGVTTEYASVTVFLLDGRKYTRHVYFGYTEDMINLRLPYFRGAIDRLSQAEWKLGAGPGWRSSHIHTRSYGFGVGIWQ